ncbi:hypothetical protein ZIOFF_066567 [Zingiber officinale]|uniref:Deoxyuridine 5'-triphosphate nucleotidohydrolase n=1 Tax=Zingiber officinale TaxID=94328 RepID=A0A8J5K7T9_ZINOF|nr:hypothetical protein ZIOFF_066567 [Zingiber officinale]
MVGRLSNTPNVGFEYSINGVVDYLISHGVRALPGRRYSTNALQGLDWVIRPIQVNIPLQPQEVNSRNLIDGRISLSFTNYTAARTNPEPNFNDLDEEDMTREELIAILTEKHPGINVPLDYEYNAYEISACQEEFPFILVHLLSNTATKPETKSSGAAGFDLSADADCVIEPRGRALISTGLNLEIPWGTYGRIATRSSAAWKLGLDVGAGVINSDYRGEIKILVFNHSSKQVVVFQEMFIAQIIFEKIIYPDIYIAPSLFDTTRGNQGFGSTDEASPSQKQPHTTRHKPNWDIFLPKEKQIISAFAEEETLIWHLQEDLGLDYARDTRPGALYSGP